MTNYYLKFIKEYALQPKGDDQLLLTITKFFEKEGFEFFNWKKTCSELFIDKDPVSLMLKLEAVDSQYANIVHINNRKRLIRALEIFELTGNGPTKHFIDQKNSQSQLLSLYTVYLYLDKNAHINKIRDRTEKMIKDGWIKEVKKLLFLQKETKKVIPPLDSIGYTQIIEYLKGSIAQDTLKEIIITKTRQYAKKQKKWFENENIDLKIDLTNLEKIDIHNYLCDIFKVI